MIILIDGPLGGYEVDTEDGPLVGVPGADLDVTVPDPDYPDLTLTYHYFVNADGKTARFLSSSFFSDAETMIWGVPKPILRPPK
jgi:hypothetical protein